MLDITPMHRPEGDYILRQDLLYDFYQGEKFWYHPFEEPVREIDLGDPLVKGGEQIQFRHFAFSPFFKIWLTPCSNYHGSPICSVCGNWDWVPRYFNRRLATPHTVDGRKWWQR